MAFASQVRSSLCHTADDRLLLGHCETRVQRIDCCYINLDGADARRETLEQSFKRWMPADWRLRRFRAIDREYVRRHAVAGCLSDAEKACLLSHRHLIRESLDDPRPLLVLEDDAMLGTRTCDQLEQLVALRDPSAWDLAFTDFLVPDVTSMVGLLRLRQQLPAGRIKLIDLRTLSFAGATAYMVNGRSKALLTLLLESETPLDVPYDILLSNLVRVRKLHACGFFPFITSLSPLAETSEIQPVAKTAPLVWNAFRRLTWVDRDLERERPGLQAIASRFCDEECAAFGTLFAAMASRELSSS